MVGVDVPVDQWPDDEFYETNKFDSKTQSYKYEDLDVIFDGMGGS